MSLAPTWGPVALVSLLMLMQAGSGRYTPPGGRMTPLWEVTNQVWDQAAIPCERSELYTRKARQADAGLSCVVSKAEALCRRWWRRRGVQCCTSSAVPFHSASLSACHAHGCVYPLSFTQVSTLNIFSSVTFSLATAVPTLLTPALPSPHVLASLNSTDYTFIKP